MSTDGILDKAHKEVPLTKKDIIFLLSLNDHTEIAKVFQMACKLRERYFGNKVFLYGFVYFSTYCRNDCAFCFYRKSNKSTLRYRKEEAEILEMASCLKESGVHLLDLTMGEDPEFFSGSHQGFEDLVKIVQNVKKNTGLPVMVSPGVVPDEIVSQFKRIGVDWYACYQETHNRQLFAKMRLGQSYDERLQKKILARKRGLLIEEGIMTGIGESPEDVAHSLEIMKNIQADQVRVMSFVPQKGTPLEQSSSPRNLRELLIIAIMRLILPDRLIPGSLDIDGIKGLEERLNAGANVVTSIIPPKVGLAGVSQSTLDIEEGKRTVAGILPVLNKCGLVPASKNNCLSWIEHRKEQHRSR